MVNKIVLGLVLTIALTQGVQAANIIWVSDNSTPVAGVPADKGWVDLLRAQGYTVDYRGEAGSGSADFQYWRTLDAAKLSELDAADLVIFSRQTDSAQYVNGTEAAQWNAVKAPMLSLSAFTARSSRWGWINATNTVAADATMEVTTPAHPLFAGVVLSANKQLDFITSSLDSFAVGTDAGNGTLLARRADNGQLWIVEWQAETEFYSGSARSAGGHRLYMAGASSINLTSEGRVVFLNAVKYMLGDLDQMSGRAGGAVPADKGTDVPRDQGLAWTPGKVAASHDVYFGVSRTDVEAADRAGPLGVLVSQGQEPNSYVPAGLLSFGQTYYWRIDEVNAAPDPTVFKGRVWRFTTEPYSYPITTPIVATASGSNGALTGPEKTVDGSGLNALDQHSFSVTDMWLSGKAGLEPTWIRYAFDAVYSLDQMWVWNSNQAIETSLGFGAKDVAIETSVDGTTWTVLPGVPQFSQATGLADYMHSTTVDFHGVQARFVKLTVNANWGGLQQTGLSEVRFFYVPVKAFGASPAQGATGVALDAELSWRPGRLAANHRVFLVADPNAFRNGTAPSEIMTEHRYGLGPLGLEYGRTYTWRVDEVNDAPSPAVWLGDLWSFTTAAYGVVDGFESYDDTCNRIFFSWVDGLGHSGSAGCQVPASTGNGTGSTVGNISPPFAEQMIVNSGRQSMPMAYDNSRSPFYSETLREWSSPQDWTRGGANTLQLAFRGDPAPFLQISGGEIVMSGMGTDIWNAADQGRFVYKSLAGDGAIVARVESLANTNAWAKAGVMIRETLESGSVCAYMPYAGANGVHFQARLTAAAAAVSDTSLPSLPPDQTGARAPVWVKLERKAGQFNGYYATDTAATTWKPMAWNPQTIAMAQNVYVGLAVTSHAAGSICGARFSSVSTSGNVSGPWQAADLGVVQPGTGNSPERFYVGVQDSAGRMKIVGHGDPVAIAAGAWVQWSVPLADLRSGGIDLSGIKKVVIGVGDRNAGKGGTAGKVFVDDIQLTRVAQP